MELFIFKTNIQTNQQVYRLKPILESHSHISRWTVDMDDIDKVLKVEADTNCCQEELIKLIKSQGIYCEELAG